MSQPRQTTEAGPARHARDRPATPPPLPRGLYLVLTNPRDGYEQVTRWAVEAGIAAVQLRYKGDDIREFLRLGTLMRRITGNTATRFIVNDRADVALMCGADGLHIGQDDAPVQTVRELIGSQMLLGLSTHTLEQVRAARTLPVDYIGFGPIHPTTSKDNPDPVVGPGQLAHAAALSAHPVVAIGGLDPDRIAALPPASCHNVAVIRAVSDAPDPLEAMRLMHRMTRTAAQHATRLGSPVGVRDGACRRADETWSETPCR